MTRIIAAALLAAVPAVAAAKAAWQTTDLALRTTLLILVGTVSLALWLGTDILASAALIFTAVQALIHGYRVKSEERDRLLKRRDEGGSRGCWKRPRRQGKGTDPIRAEIHSKDSA